MQEPIKLEDDGACQKCGAGGCEIHSCPYESELNGDDGDHCNCCADCEMQCALDI